MGKGTPPRRICIVFLILMDLVSFSYKLLQLDPEIGGVNAHL